MSDQAAPVARPSSPPPDRGGARLTFFDLAAKKGAFMYEPEEGAAHVPTSFVMGYYVQHWLEWDEGNPNAARQQDRIPPRWKLRVILRDAECERGRIGMAWVTIAPKSAFYGAAHGLAQCSPNEFLGFKAVPGDDACFVNVDRWDGGAWSGMLTPKNDGRDFDVRYEEAVRTIQGAPGYQAYEKKIRDEGEGQKRQGAPVQTSAGAEATGTKTDNAGDGAPAVPEGKEAFGYRPGRWPKAADWDREPTQSVLQLLQKKVAERSLAADGPGGVASMTSVAKVADAIAAAYDLPKSSFLSQGRAMLAYDLLANGTPETIAALGQAAFPVARAEEYDPFADE